MIKLLNNLFGKKKKNKEQFFLDEKYDILVKEFKKEDTLKILEYWCVAGFKFNQSHMIVWLDGVREVYFPEFTTLKNENDIMDDDANGVFLVKVFCLNKNLNKQIESGKRINL